MVSLNRKWCCARTVHFPRTLPRCRLIYMARQRSLAAIVAADVVGFSCLVGQDEEGTLSALRAAREEIVDPLLEQHGGRVANTAGDSLLIEFSSVVEAVRFCVALQRTMALRTQESQDLPQLAFRVGVSLGDVVRHGGDIMGDGVNIAARLEARAVAGGIAMSEDAYRQVRDRVQEEWKDSGEHRLKNIRHLVRVFTWQPSTSVQTAKPSHRENGGAAPHAGEQPDRFSTAPPSKLIRFAVLPLDDWSASEAIGTGIAEDIVTELLRFHQFSVLSTTSSARFKKDRKGSDAPGPFEVDYLIDGSVRRHGEQLRINVRLIDEFDNRQIWAERFDVASGEVGAAYDRMIERVVATVAGRAEAVTADRARRKMPSSLAAYECVLRGIALPIGDHTTEAEACALFERAVELEPTYALAHVKIAHMQTLRWDRDPFAQDALLDEALARARRAVALDPTDPYCQYYLGFVHLFRQSHANAERHVLRSLELNPNDANLIARAGLIHAFLGDGAEARSKLSLARQLDPFFEPSWLWHAAGLAEFVAERVSEAIAAFERSPTPPLWVKAYLACCLALSGDLAGVKRYRDQVLAERPQFSSRRFAAREPLKRPEDRLRLLTGLEQAGLPA